MTYMKKLGKNLKHGMTNRRKRYFWLNSGCVHSICHCIEQLAASSEKLVDMQIAGFDQGPPMLSNQT